VLHFAPELRVVGARRDIRREQNRRGLTGLAAVKTVRGAANHDQYLPIWQAS
jgi:hypothetical protein